MLYSLLVFYLTIHATYLCVTVIRDVVGDRHSGVKLDRDEKTLVTLLCLISVFFSFVLCLEVYYILGGLL